MSNTFFEKPHRRHVSELNIVPVLDMLTTIIFFLLLSTSFMEFNKLTVPPAQVSTITDPVAPPPLQPRLAVTRVGASYQVLLTWAGPVPGSVKQADVASAQALFTVLSKVVKEFKVRFPSESTLQMGLGRDVPFEDLIWAMDAVRESISDIVLYSPEEAEAEMLKMGATPGET